MIDVCVPFLGRFKITNSYPTIKYAEKTTSVDNQHLVPIKNFVKCLMVIDFSYNSANNNQQPQ